MNIINLNTFPSVLPPSSLVKDQSEQDVKVQFDKNCFNLKATDLLPRALPAQKKALPAQLNLTQEEAYTSIQDKEANSKFVNMTIYFSESMKFAKTILHKVGGIFDICGHFFSVVESNTNFSECYVSMLAHLNTYGSLSNFVFSKSLFVALSLSKYKEFEELRQEIFQTSLLKKFLSEDDTLRNFICPLSGDLPKFPVTIISAEKNPKNIHFDLEAISKWLENNQGKIFPDFKGTFKLNELEPDFSCIASMVNHLERLIESCLKKDELPHIALYLPKELKVKKIILEYCRVNPILISLNKISRIFQETRKKEILKFIHELLEQERRGKITGINIGYELEVFRSKIVQKIKLAEPYQQSFLYKFFGVQANLEKFILTLNSSESESNVASIEELL